MKSRYIKVLKPHNDTFNLLVNEPKSRLRILLQRYVEESKKEKERLVEEMSCQKGKEGNVEAGADGDYHVTDADNSGKMTEEEPKDPLYLVDSDAYSLDMPLPTEASK